MKINIKISKIVYFYASLFVKLSFNFSVLYFSFIIKHLHYIIKNCDYIQNKNTIIDEIKIRQI